MTWAILFIRTPDSKPGLTSPAVGGPPYTFLLDYCTAGGETGLQTSKGSSQKMGRSAPSALLSPHVASAADTPKSLPQTGDAITWHEVAQGPAVPGPGDANVAGGAGARECRPARRSQRMLTQRWEPGPAARSRGSGCQARSCHCHATEGALAQPRTPGGLSAALGSPNLPSTRPHLEAGTAHQLRGRTDPAT